MKSMRTTAYEIIELMALKTQEMVPTNVYKKQFPAVNKS